jgi:hypothetical protein
MQIDRFACAAVAQRTSPCHTASNQSNTARCHPSAGISKAAGSLELQDVQEGMDTDEGIRTLSPLT